MYMLSLDARVDGGQYEQRKAKGMEANTKDTKAQAEEERLGSSRRERRKGEGQGDGEEGKGGWG